ncbi:MAG: hypothetical protein JNL66_15220 [Alphaproteobacteria bacterium]|nr:hypothetical protein [Alphaproteobacteria bacterium]
MANRQAGRRAQRWCRLVLGVAGLGVGILAADLPASAQEWTDPGIDDWFDASNWNPSQVPLAGGVVVISNGGTATLASPPASTPSLGSLHVGTSSLGTGIGTITSNGVTILVGGTVEVGTVSLSGQTATGTVAITGAGQLLGGGFGSLFVGTGAPAADGQVIIATGTVSAAAGVSGFSAYRVGTLTGAVGAGSVANGSVIGLGAPAPSSVSNVAVGAIFGTDAGQGSATGVLALGGPQNLNFAGVTVGNIFGAAGGSAANGSVSIAGNAGSAAGFVIVGNISASDLSQVGSTATGSFQVANGGNFAFQPGTNVFIGTTFGPDRDGSLVNTATGTVVVEGTLSAAGTQISIGLTSGGIVNGSLNVGAIDTVAIPLSFLSVGTSQAGGQATGSLIAGDGTLRVNGGVSVGTTANGTAQGTIEIGGTGALIGNGGLFVGTASASAGQVVSAIGSVEAAGGVSGFTNYQIGVLTGGFGDGSVAQGTVIGSGALPPAAVGFVTVGSILGTDAGQGSATGVLALGGPQNLNFAGVTVGNIFGAAGGSVANGSVSIAGNAGSAAGFFIVGNISASDLSQVGSTATGSFAVANGGNFAFQPGTGAFIGTTFGPDRDGSAVNTATGTVVVEGTLSASATGIVIGQTNGGVVNGSLSVGAIDTSAVPLTFLNVGISLAGGQATGALTAGGGTLNVANTLFIGISSGGTAVGTLDLTATALTAQAVSAGQGAGGTAHILLRQSTASIAGSFALGTGTLLMDNSFMAVTSQFTLGDGATLIIDVDGLVRGSEYGAIDAGTAVLAGTLRLDFSSFSDIGGDVVFDIVRSSALDGISGDFASLLFTGLYNTYSFVAGVEIDGGVDIYRVRMSVPEPLTLALVLPALLLLPLIRRRRAAA